MLLEARAADEQGSLQGRTHPSTVSKIQRIRAASGQSSSTEGGGFIVLQAGNPCGHRSSSFSQARLSCQVTGRTERNLQTMKSWPLLFDERTIKVRPERAQSIDDSPLCVRSNVARAAVYTIVFAGAKRPYSWPRCSFLATHSKILRDAGPIIERRLNLH
jgi:hypothetical protein